MNTENIMGTIRSHPLTPLAASQLRDRGCWVEEDERGSGRVTPIISLTQPQQAGVLKAGYEQSSF